MSELYIYLCYTQMKEIHSPKKLMFCPECHGEVELMRKLEYSGDKVISKAPTKPKPKVKWIGTWPSKCDLCKCELEQQSCFYDASVPTHGGSWGLICSTCFSIHGCKTGTGFGQKYDSRTLEKLEG